MAALRRFLLLPRLWFITCVSAASLLILFSQEIPAESAINATAIDRTAIDPAAIDPAAIDPAAIDPAAIDPAAIDPAAIDPAAIDPAAIDLAAIDPAAIDPAATDPAAIDATAIDPATIDLTPLVNALIHSSQSGSRQLFSLLSVSSFSHLDLHKLTLLVYNISSVKSLDSGLFRRRFCYCVTNDTNDLSDFTAILLDVMGNSTSYLQELFRSSSILSVSQRNDSDCIYICVMAGKTGREVSGFWDDGSVTPLFNQTIVEGPNRVANISSIRLPVASPHLGRTSSTTLKVTTSVGVTPTPSRPPGFTTGRPSTETPNIWTIQSISTPRIRTSAGTVRRPTSAAAPVPSAVTPRPPAAAAAGAATAPSAVTPRPPAAAAAGAATAPSAVTPRPPAAAAAGAATAPSAVTPRPSAAADTAPAPSAVTPRPPADAGAATAPAPSAVTARPPADAGAGAATAPSAVTARPPAPSAVTAQPPADAGAATAPAPSAVTPRPPADTTFLKSPDSLMETNISPTSLQTTFIRPSTPRPTGRPAETKPSSKDATPDRPRETERPGCPWRRPEPGGEAETLGELKLQPCVLQLCRFFSQCLCRPLSRTTRTKRYCDSSFLWYEEQTFEVCRRVKRFSFSRNLKQRCLSKMCNKL
ncbi:uncharacterized protein hhla1 [Xiphophorus couchianus]|uniref:uncharacterized protein hhla1 n=1 Tax=Xiphophorus couchianus TaxID=32473 RepID=UPI001015D6A3|nr:HERV-H LTR-associating protein 1 [Xiphophorus couchianus]